MQAQKGGLLSPPQWNIAGTNRPAPFDPLAQAAQAQQMALQQAATPGPAGSSYSTITRGQPMDFDLMRMQMMGIQGNGAQQPGRQDPTPGSKPPMGGGNGGQQPGGGNGDPRFNMFSWQGFAGLPGVKEGDLGSIMRYYANRASREPRPLNMKQWFGNPSQPGHER